MTRWAETEELAEQWQCPACDRWFTNHDPENELCIYCRGELAAAVAEIVSEAEE